MLNSIYNCHTLSYRPSCWGTWCSRPRSSLLGKTPLHKLPSDCYCITQIIQFQNVQCFLNALSFRRPYFSSSGPRLCNTSSGTWKLMFQRSRCIVTCWYLRLQVLLLMLIRTHVRTFVRIGLLRTYGFSAACGMMWRRAVTRPKWERFYTLLAIESALSFLLADRGSLKTCHTHHISQHELYIFKFAL